ncbi:hypothetical protein D915_007006 [Fasciola hepatica]|uniref:Uncharacterized protein n=1 Tax=Fasciola hepatica TaxID=6192 RepID=A0A4E0RNK2_FASHE|nr:hypothetical protein D915_007006 [Fasciola hepatica]
MFARIQGVGADFDRAMAHFMITGRELRPPIDLAVPQLAYDIRTSKDYAVYLCLSIDDSDGPADTHLRILQLHQKNFYHTKAHGKPVQPSEGVWMRSTTQIPGIPSKLEHVWTRPFTVMKILGPTACCVAGVCENPEALQPAGASGTQRWNS